MNKGDVHVGHLQVPEALFQGRSDVAAVLLRGYLRGDEELSTLRRAKRAEERSDELELRDERSESHED